MPARGQDADGGALLCLSAATALERGIELRVGRVEALPVLLRTRSTASRIARGDVPAMLRLRLFDALPPPLLFRHSPSLPLPCRQFRAFAGSPALRVSRATQLDRVLGRAASETPTSLASARNHTPERRSVATSCNTELPRLHWCSAPDLGSRVLAFWMSCVAGDKVRHASDGQADEGTTRKHWWRAT